MPLPWLQSYGDSEYETRQGFYSLSLTVKLGMMQALETLGIHC